MNKTKAYIILKYFIAVALIVVSLVFVIFNVIDYVNYTDISSHSKESYLVGIISFSILFIASIICLIVLLKREKYRSNFTKKH